MGIDLLAVSDRLLAAVINGTYQGIVITVLVALSLRLLGRANAATRHAVWFCTLALLVVLVVAHCFVHSPPDALQSGGIARVAAPQEPERASPDLAGVLALPRGGPMELDSSATDRLDRWPAEDAATHRRESDPLPLTSAGPPDDELTLSAGSPPFPGAGLSEPGPDPSGPSVAGADPATSGVGDRFAWLDTWMRRVARPASWTLALESRPARIAGAILLGFCLALAGARILGLLIRLIQIRNLKRHSLPVSAAFNELFQGLVARLRIERSVALRMSPASESSILLGFFHPVILLPCQDEWEPREAEQILRHELAHVERRDDWTNLVQHFILAAFPFHPAAWWISRQLSLEREIACDDHVLQSSAPPRAYALLLAEMAARMQRRPPLLAPGASNGKTQLQQRIDMILNKHRNASPRPATSWLAIITSAAVLVAVAVLCAAPRIVLAQGAPAPAVAAAPSDAAPAVEIAAVAPAPAAPESDSTPAVPPRPAGIGSGPKFKTGVPAPAAAPAALPVQPAAPAPAAVPAPAAPLALTTPPALEASPRGLLVSADALPKPARARTPAPGRAPAAEASLEERLERLERLVESLMAREGAGQDLYRHKPLFEKYGQPTRERIDQIEKEAKLRAELERKHAEDRKEMDLSRERAKHDAARLADEAKRGAEAERADRAREKRQRRDLKEGSQKQLEILRQRLEKLEREREELDRQIEELERNREQVDEEVDQDRSADAPPDAPESRDVSKP